MTNNNAIWLTMLAATTIVVSSHAAWAADIALRRAATPKSTVVRLGDVAEIRSADDREAKRLAALPIMPAPTSGIPRFLRMREVQDLLAAHGEDLRQLNFQGELTVEVAPLATAADPAPAKTDVAKAASETRRSAWLNGSATTPDAKSEAAAVADAPIAEVRDHVTQTIIAYLNRITGQPSAWKVKVNSPSIDLQQLAGATTALKCEGGLAPWTGKQRFVVKFSTARGETQISVLADVVLPQTVAVAVRPIDRGDVVTAADIELQEWESLPPTANRRTVFDSTEKLIGMEAVRAIQVGEAFYSDTVRAQLLIKRGDEVTVYARGGGIQVRTFAKAKQDGARGELVQLESFDTREPFDAVVSGRREAVVFAGGASPNTEVAEKPFRRPNH